MSSDDEATHHGPPGYTGQVNSKNHPHGYGTQLCRNGDIYEGNWFNGKPHGRGNYRYASGAFYEGDFDMGVRHGKGIYGYVNGQLYDGSWVRGKRHGYGRLCSDRNVPVDKADIYEGEFVDGLQHGKGILQFGNGDQFDGNFVHGVRKGVGILSTTNGNKYQGQWNDDYPEGFGAFTVRSLHRHFVGFFVKGVLERPLCVPPKHTARKDAPACFYPPGSDVCTRCGYSKNMECPHIAGFSRVEAPMDSSLMAHKGSGKDLKEHAPETEERGKERRRSLTGIEKEQTFDLPRPSRPTSATSRPATTPSSSRPTSATSRPPGSRPQSATSRRSGESGSSTSSMGMSADVSREAVIEASRKALASVTSGLGMAVADMPVRGQERTVVRVVEVAPNSTAASIPLARGDYILSFNNKPCKSKNVLLAATQSVQPGTECLLAYVQREGTEKKKTNFVIGGNVAPADYKFLSEISHIEAEGRPLPKQVLNKIGNIQLLTQCVAFR